MLSSQLQMGRRSGPLCSPRHSRGIYSFQFLMCVGLDVSFQVSGPHSCPALSCPGPDRADLLGSRVRSSSVLHYSYKGQILSLVCPSVTGGESLLICCQRGPLIFTICLVSSQPCIIFLQQFERNQQSHQFHYPYSYYLV